MRQNIITLILLACAALMAACSDDDSFSSAPGRQLSFSTDTLRLDTLFSGVPSAAKSFWVYNRTGDGVRCTSVRLERGGASGFRVNVDGEYLSPDRDYAVSDVELRNGDSLRVYVELTSPVNNTPEPTLDEDNIVFTLENGQEQRVNLSAWTWDALSMRNVVISGDLTIDGQGRPIIIYGGLRVDSAATLTIAAGTTLYFHSDCGMDVYGTLRSLGTPDNNVILRGDRIDKMFDYLPYDRTPGQWQGVRIHSSSYDNLLSYTDIHSTQDGVVIDSSDVSRPKADFMGCIIHNCQGDGIRIVNSRVSLTNCQLTNTLGSCLSVDGGVVSVNGCTMAQFYPFDSSRGPALAFTSAHPLESLNVSNSIITGYADDQMMGTEVDSTAFNYAFDHCVIRTPRITTDDSVKFTNVIYEDIKDTTRFGEKHFIKVDLDQQDYDFRLDSVSAAIGIADPATAPPTDRLGIRRKEKPDAGAYEYQQP